MMEFVVYIGVTVRACVMGGVFWHGCRVIRDHDLL